MLETKIDLKKTALLVIDMQNGLAKLDEEPYTELYQMVRANKVIENTEKVVKAARKVGMPIIHIRHIGRADGADSVPTITDLMLEGAATAWRPTVKGTPGAEFIDELKPAPEDDVVEKRRGNAFCGSDLELLLRSRGVDTVIATGLVTNGCVDATVRGARERDFHVIVLSDCCAALTKEDHEYSIKNTFRRLGRVRTSGEIVAVMTG